ncbi:MAG TPA: universal stress protein [Bryobacteraceae bacterium]|nr:universal stress protein [Bryobacteraceae bacterium]
MLKLQKILFPMDFSERSRAAAPFVLSLAQRYEAQVILLHVFEPPPANYAGMGVLYPEIYDFDDMRGDLLPKLVEFAATELPKVDMACRVELGSVAAVITEYADANQIDLIAMPTHGYGPFRRALLGSVTAKVLHDARVPVWTSAHAPEPSHRAHPKPRFILAALDMQPESQHTLEAALQLGRESGAHVEIVYVAPEGEISQEHAESRMAELIARVEREQSATVAEYEEAQADVVVDGGSIAQFIRRAALRQRSDLIVIGRGCIQGGLSRLRANAYTIIREAPCPVFSV